MQCSVAHSELLSRAGHRSGGTSLVSMLGKTPLKTPRTRAALSFVDGTSTLRRSVENATNALVHSRVGLSDLRIHHN